MFWQSAGGLFKRIAVVEIKSKLLSRDISFFKNSLEYPRLIFTLDLPQVDLYA